MAKIKKYIGYCLCAFLISCAYNDADRQPILNDKPQDAALEIAQKYFEYKISNSKTRSGSFRIMQYSAITPGDFTPLWKEATVMSNPTRDIINIPILAKNRYSVSGITVNNGNIKKFKADIIQQIVVVRQKRSNRLSMRILSIIPTKALSNGTDKKISSVSNLKNYQFSGIMVTHSATGKTLSVTKYENGQKKTIQSSYQNHAETRQLLGDIKIRKRMNLTRSFDEDWCDCGNCPECGYFEEDECPFCGSTSCWGECEDDDECPFCGSTSCWGDCDDYYCFSCGSIYCWGECESDMCPNCGSDLCWGDCNDRCSTCGDDPCTCNVCFWCGNDPCTCDDTCPWCGNDPCSCEPIDHRCDECGEIWYGCTCGTDPDNPWPEPGLIVTCSQCHRDLFWNLEDPIIQCSCGVWIRPVV